MEYEIGGLSILRDNLDVTLDVLGEEELLKEECSVAVTNVSAEIQICYPNSLLLHKRKNGFMISM